MLVYEIQWDSKGSRLTYIDLIPFKSNLLINKNHYLQIQYCNKTKILLILTLAILQRFQSVYVTIKK